MWPLWPRLTFTSNDGAAQIVGNVLMPQASSSSLARRPKGTAQAVPFFDVDEKPAGLKPRAHSPGRLYSKS